MVILTAIFDEPCQELVNTSTASSIGTSTYRPIDVHRLDGVRSTASSLILHGYRVQNRLICKSYFSNNALAAQDHERAVRTSQHFCLCIVRHSRCRGSAAAAWVHHPLVGLGVLLDLYCTYVEILAPLHFSCTLFQALPLIGTTHECTVLIFRGPRIVLSRCTYTTSCRSNRHGYRGHNM